MDGEPSGWDEIGYGWLTARGIMCTWMGDGWHQKKSEGLMMLGVDAGLVKASTAGLTHAQGRWSKAGAKAKRFKRGATVASATASTIVDWIVLLLRKFSGACTLPTPTQPDVASPSTCFARSGQAPATRFFLFAVWSLKMEKMRRKSSNSYQQQIQGKEMSGCC